MGRYSKVDRRLWGDAKFCSLSAPQPNAQTLWIYLLIGPHQRSIPGLFTIGRAATAECLDWPLEEFDKRFHELSSRGMAKADWKARVVWLPNATSYSRPENPNVVKSWPKIWDEVPECQLKNEAYEALKRLLHSMGKSFLQPFIDGCTKGMSNPDPDPEPDPEQDLTFGQRPAAGVVPSQKKLFRSPGGAGSFYASRHTPGSCRCSEGSTDPECKALRSELRACQREFDLGLAEMEKYGTVMRQVRAAWKGAPTGKKRRYFREALKNAHVETLKAQAKEPPAPPPLAKATLARQREAQGAQPKVGGDGQWQLLRTAIRKEIGEANWKTWFASAVYRGSVNGRDFITVPNHIFREWIEEEYSKMIAKLAKPMDFRPVFVELP